MFSFSQQNLRKYLSFFTVIFLFCCNDSKPYKYFQVDRRSGSGSMGLVKLNVLIRDRACEPHPREWWVDIYNCQDKPLQYCGKTYVDMKTEHAHLEVDVPSGIYKIRAHSSCGNIWTDTAIVVCGCGQVCVNLYDPTFWRCGITIVPALVAQGMIAGIEPREINRAVSVILEVMDKVTPPVERVYLRPERVDAMAKLLEDPYRSALQAQREALMGPIKEQRKR